MCRASSFAPGVTILAPSFPQKLRRDGLECDCCTDDSSYEIESASLEKVIDPNGTAKKSVRFDQVEIREYGIILGDNPSAYYGPPITIEWRPQAKVSMNVGDYEESKIGNPLRYGDDLILSHGMRMKLLSPHFPLREIIEAQHEVRRIALCREKSWHEKEGSCNSTAQRFQRFREKHRWHVKKQPPKHASSSKVMAMDSTQGFRSIHW
jgi:hypothetical protein